MAKKRFDGIDDAGELDQQAVAHQLHNAAVMLFDLRIDQLGAMRLLPRDRTTLISLHEPGIPDHVSGKDCCKSTLLALLYHVPNPGQGLLTFSLWVALVGVYQRRYTTSGLGLSYASAALAACVWIQAQCGHCGSEV